MKDIVYVNRINTFLRQTIMYRKKHLLMISFLMKTGFQKFGNRQYPKRLM